MKGLLPLLFLPVLAAAQSSCPLVGGTRTFVGNDVVNTFTETGTLVVSVETTVRALFVAGGGGSGFAHTGSIAPGGRGGCGVVIAAYDLQPAETLILVK